jgi:hypothetical protein
MESVETPKSRRNLKEDPERVCARDNWRDRVIAIVLQHALLFVCLFSFGSISRYDM